MDYPNLSILVVTYNRKNTLRNSLLAIKQHLAYNGNKRIFVADDGSDDGTQDMLAAEFPEATIVQSIRSKLGANTNAGIRSALLFSDYILQFQDDMKLLVNLDMHPHIELLRDNPGCGMIRLWGVGGHKYQAQLEGNYWRVWWTSPELYIPSDRPHVKHRRFHEAFGFYPEGLSTAETEQTWCHQCKDAAGKLSKSQDVYVPQNALTETTWEHCEWGNRWRDKGL